MFHGRAFAFRIPRQLQAVGRRLRHADAVSAYLKPGVDLKKYDSVLIDPVTTVIATPGISAEVKDQLAAYLGDSLRSQSAGKLKLVGSPGPTTIRVRTALTDVMENKNRALR